MTVAKWWCKNCKKIIYNEGFKEPECKCSGEMELIWLNLKPTKRVWDEIEASGSELRRKNVTKEAVWDFTATMCADEGETKEDLLEKLPF